jgi:mannose-6-phosphate isomerase-like protein (cupin superfamily)
MVEKPKPGSEFWTEERCYITELVNSPRWPGVSLARCRVPPGITTQLHSLSVLEWYVVESGEGRMRVGHAPPWRIARGSRVMIPAACEQQVTNTGPEQLLFLCVCTPRFTTQCYTSHE